MLCGIFSYVIMRILAKSLNYNNAHYIHCAIGQLARRAPRTRGLVTRAIDLLVSAQSAVWPNGTTV